MPLSKRVAHFNKHVTVNPMLLTDATRHDVPLPARWILGIIDVEDFLTLEPIRH